MRAYSHNNGELAFKRGTIALDLPSKQDLETLFTKHGTATLVYIGAARLATKAKFVKKQGRSFAEDMMDWFPAYLQRVEIRGTKHVYHFIAENLPNKTPDEESTQKVEFGVSTVAETDDVHLVYAFFQENWDY